ncbi:hypothetical protein Arad_2097 [Rhizobium rhizogenes K84]|uniref:Uncharacterized protein n=1 Tax=Rhizobium rhizogenes (strain K84 / ATCC BAA-868) TaxID=311403 RepID=B9JEE9_RHIR8|nr:hypothetical protein Arad_2097 [Rhizobium rhizogenes K84]
MMKTAAGGGNAGSFLCAHLTSIWRSLKYGNLLPAAIP